MQLQTSPRNAARVPELHNLFIQLAVPESAPDIMSQGHFEKQLQHAICFTSANYTNTPSFESAYGYLEIAQFQPPPALFPGSQSRTIRKQDMQASPANPLGSEILQYRSVHALSCWLPSHQRTCDYAMGYYRPGNCNPAHRQNHCLDRSQRGSMHSDSERCNRPFNSVKSISFWLRRQSVGFCLETPGYHQYRRVQLAPTLSPVDLQLSKQVSQQVRFPTQITTILRLAPTFKFVKTLRIAPSRKVTK